MTWERFLSNSSQCPEGVCILHTLNIQPTAYLTSDAAVCTGALWGAACPGCPLLCGPLIVYCPSISPSLHIPFPPRRIRFPWIRGAKKKKKEFNESSKLSIIWVQIYIVMCRTKKVWHKHFDMTCAFARKGAIHLGFSYSDNYGAVRIQGHNISPRTKVWSSTPT